MPRLLIVDDEPGIRRTLMALLEKQDYDVEGAADGKEALAAIEAGSFDLVLSDMMMPNMNGMDLLKASKAKWPELPFVMLTANATIELAVEAIKEGAYDFVPKPPNLQRFLVTIRNALAAEKLQREHGRMKARLEKIDTDIPPLLGESAPMKRIKKLLEKAAPSEARVLVTGEAGSGKELIAQWVHHLSDRSGGPFVAVNCAAIPSDLIESELFGHEKGAFTGAHKQHIGSFEQADGGTLFLDEVGDMATSAQAKVLRVLQESRVRRVGGDKDIAINVRVVAATNKDLERAIQDGTFRDDLFHRLAVIRIESPPLRERAEDIDALAAFFCEKLGRRNGRPEKRFSDSALRLLRTYPWRGNVRELHNAVERLIVLSDADEITADDVELFANPGSAPQDSVAYLVGQYPKIADFRDAAEAVFLRRKLAEFEGNISRMSEEIDLQRSNIYAKLKKFDIPY
ncbi:MAG: sigma-54 dependent transcriptional regulator [Rhodothermales bacterium]